MAYPGRRHPAPGSTRVTPSCTVLIADRSSVLLCWTNPRLLRYEVVPLSPVLQREEPVVRPAKPEQAAWPPVWQVVVLSLLLFGLYLLTLTHLVSQWWNNSNFSHGFIVPLFSGFVIWQERSRLARVNLQPAWLGLVLVGLGLGVLVVGQLGAELFLPLFLADRARRIGRPAPRMEILPRHSVPLGVPVADDSPSRHHLQPDHISTAAVNFQGCQHDSALDGRARIPGRQPH